MQHLCRNLDALFDYFVGACGETGRYFESERPGRFEVDNELELGGLIDRHVGGLLALENPRSVEPGPTIGVCNVVAIAHQPALRQDPEARLTPGTATLPLCSRTNASPFWIIMLSMANS